MIVSDLKYIRRRIQLVRKVAKLDIANAGIDEEGVPFVKLNNGPVFYGLLSWPKLKKYYNLLPVKTKSVLPFECFLVANDIVIRYFEGGLQLGGPEKELFYSVKSGDYIAEMGAYMGHYTIYLSEKIGPKGKVIAIEPMPDNLKILKKNIEKNNLTNVDIVPKGVWKEKNEIIFQRKKGDHQSGSIELNYTDKDSLKIPVDSLDNILNEQAVSHVDFMLIQLNGVEVEALEGLDNFKPENMAVAARYKKEDKPAGLMISEILKARNYNCKIVKRDFVFAKLNK
ncbi:MAG: FkbM family methyltransferase [Bacteroidales bacterium]|nr:FkbM family methyltransferase [Bacteroidales bacterium]